MCYVNTGQCDRCDHETEVTVIGEQTLCDICAAEIRKEESKRARRNERARKRRAAVRDAMDSIGVKRVRGNLGGVFWE